MPSPTLANPKEKGNGLGPVVKESYYGPHSVPLSAIAQHGAIRVWPFKDAPVKYRLMSENGGDEDWLALVPSCYSGHHLGWLKEGTPFGSCSVECHIVEDGLVFIGAHS